MTEMRGIVPLKLDEGVMSVMLWIAAVLHRWYREEFGSGLLLCFGVTVRARSYKGHNTYRQLLRLTDEILSSFSKKKLSLYQHRHIR